MDIDQYRVQNMTEAETAMFAAETANREKSVAVGYLAWLLVGFHYAYVGRWAAQILFWLTGGGLLVWWLIDLFRIPTIIEQHNREVRDSVALSITSLRSGGVTTPSTSASAGRTLVSSREESLGTVGQLVIPFVGIGALVGFFLMAFTYPSFRSWRHEYEAGALCQCSQLAVASGTDILTMEFRGASVGGLVGALGLIPVFERTRRRARLLKLQSQ